MERRTFLALVPGGLLAAPLRAEAQQAGKVPRVGILGSTPTPSWESFRQALRELGYVEGRTIILEYRWLEGAVDRAPAAATELVNLKVDVIVAVSVPVIRAAQRASGTIPIVMAASFDAVGTGLVASLARPGGNTTGLTLLSTAVVVKRLELLREAVPKVSRLAVLLGPPAPADSLLLREVEAGAQAMNMRLQILRAGDPTEVQRAFAAMTRERASAVLMSEHPFLFSPKARVAELAAKHRLPTMVSFREFVERGALMSYGADLADLYGRAAVYVDKILKGAKPADLPVEQPTKFTLVMNLKTAKALGLTIPPSLLARADQVIQ
jgi:putative tryptophan/tyrosine transport system substrate-binding protein